jgi:hypothetical protein
MATDSVKPSASLVNDASAAENAAMASDEHLEKIQELHGLSQRELAPFRLVTNTFTNVSNSVKRNAKTLGPGSGDPEWANKRRERERKLQKLTDGPIVRLTRVNQWRASSRATGRKTTLKRTMAILLQAAPASNRTTQLLQLQGPVMDANLNVSKQ